MIFDIFGAFLRKAGLKGLQIFQKCENGKKCLKVIIEHVQKYPNECLQNDFCYDAFFLVHLVTLWCPLQIHIFVRLCRFGFH